MYASWVSLPNHHYPGDGEVVKSSKSERDEANENGEWSALKLSAHGKWSALIPSALNRRTAD